MFLFLISSGKLQFIYQVKKVDISYWGFWKVCVDFRHQVDEQVDVVLLTLTHVVNETNVLKINFFVFFSIINSLNNSVWWLWIFLFFFRQPENPTTL
jgi:hypothetical protein